MKVLLVNGSPHKNGNTYTALTVVEDILQKNDIETEHFHIGDSMIRGCIDCERCKDTNRCVFADDPCNALIEAFLRADGIIIGTPVYFAGPNGALCALLDRVFYAASTHGRLLRGKPAAALACCYINALKAGEISGLYDCENKRYNIFDLEMANEIEKCYKSLSNAERQTFYGIFKKMWENCYNSSDFILEKSVSGFEKLKRSIIENQIIEKGKGLNLKVALSEMFVQTVDSIVTKIKEKIKEDK